MPRGTRSREIRISPEFAGVTGGAAEALVVVWCPGRLEKPLAAGFSQEEAGRPHNPYRTPTQVGRGKDPKVDERSSVKELGKLTP